MLGFGHNRQFLEAVHELNHFLGTATTAAALGIDYSAFNDLAGQVVEVTTAE